MNPIKQIPNQINNLIVRSKDEFENAKVIATQIFLNNEFPDPIFKHEEWELMFFEPWDIFHENAYDTFFSLAKDIKENEFYLSPDFIVKYDTMKYLNNIKDDSHCPVIKFSSNLSFKNFNSLQEKYNYSMVTNSFL